MQSKARSRLIESKADVDRILFIHGEVSDTTVGRKFGVGCLNKSAIVLTCAVWEAYVEDLCEEAVLHLGNHINNSLGLPAALKSTIGRELASQQASNPETIWDALCGDPKTALLLNFTIVRNKYWSGQPFNTPKWENVDKLYETTLALSNISECWNWQHVRFPKNRTRLNGYVVLRGGIAHRNASPSSINKPHCRDFLELVEHMAEKMDARVHTYLAGLCSVPFF